MPVYTLPDLPYDYSALEPHLSGRIIELHHDKHHRAYVDGANLALEKLAEARVTNKLEPVAALERALAFNLSGHVLHSVYWQNLAPKAGGRPFGELAERLNRDFGSFDAFRAQLIAAASTIMGSGWAALAWDPIGRRLMTIEIHDHQSETTQAGLPILVLDAWEHAYYLQYGSEKRKYFEAIWNLWKWDDVARRLHAAMQLDLSLAHVAQPETRL